MSVAIVVCYSGTDLRDGPIPFQRSPTECVYVCLCVSLSVMGWNSKSLHQVEEVRLGKKVRSLLFYSFNP